MKLKIGDKAPGFTLMASDKSLVNLADYKGRKVLVLFFPFAFSGVCTKELCGIRDENEFYKDLNVEILAISVDSFFSLAKFKEDMGYTYPLLSDFNKDVARAYGAIYEELPSGMKGVAKRSAFVVDEEGILRYVEVLENAGDLPDIAKIKEVLNNLS